MKQILSYLKTNYFKISVFVIIFFSILLRFYDYENRIVFGQDQVHSVLVARHALETKSLPLLGPFSSAGPFQTGGEWYWIVMAGVFFAPFWVLSPFVFLTLSSILFVYLMTRFGQELIDKKFAIIVGLLTSVSSAQIISSLNLTNQSPIALFSLLTIWSTVFYLRKKRVKYLFWSAFFASLAFTIHLQGILLFAIPLIVVIFARFQILRSLFFLVVGTILPLLPLIISDVGRNLFNIRNMIHYYLYDQYKISFEVLNRRWLTYLSDYWPATWGTVVGGNKWFGYFFILSTVILSLYLLYKRKLAKEWFVMGASFLLMVFVLRYTRTPLFENYTLFAHPFILLLSAWAIYEILKKNQIFGILILIACIISSFSINIEKIKSSKNFTLSQVRAWSTFLQTKFPNQTFSVYDYQYKTTSNSLALVLLLDIDKKIDKKGRRIGVIIGPQAQEGHYEVLLGKLLNFQLLLLEKMREENEYFKLGWARVNLDDIYRSSQDWFKK